MGMVEMAGRHYVGHNGRPNSLGDFSVNVIIFLLYKFDCIQIKLHHN